MSFGHWWVHVVRIDWDAGTGYGQMEASCLTRLADGVCITMVFEELDIFLALLLALCLFEECLGKLWEPSSSLFVNDLPSTYPLDPGMTIPSTLLHLTTKDTFKY